MPSDLALPALAGCPLRVKLFDYGVVSLAISCPVAGTWEALIDAGHRVSGLEAEAADVCRTLAARLAPTLVRGRPPEPELSEDYIVYAVTALDEPMTADRLLDQQGERIAALLRGEREPLSAQEREEVLRHRLSYLADDLVIPTWSSALVCDTEAGVQAALEILEFANSQLLEFRYYDNLLDDGLGRIYDSLKRPRWHDWLAAGGCCAKRSTCMPSSSTSTS